MNNYMFDLLPEKDFLPVLSQFKRVLKPGGRLVLVNMTKGEHVYQRFWEAVYHVNPAWLGGCRGVLLAQAVQTAGFVSIWPIRFPIGDHFSHKVGHKSIRSYDPGSISSASRSGDATERVVATGPSPPAPDRAERSIGDPAAEVLPRALSRADSGASQALPPAPRKRGWVRLLAVAAVGGLVMTAWDLVMDPIMVAGGYWVWDV